MPVSEMAESRIAVTEDAASGRTTAGDAASSDASSDRAASGDTASGDTASSRAVAPPPDPTGATYLAARLDVVEARIRSVLTARGHAMSGSDVRSVEERLAIAEAVGDRTEALGTRPRLRALADACGLEATDVEFLLIALAPEADPRFGQLYSYLHDDADRRRATVGLALELCGAAPMDAAHRSRFHPGAPLSSNGLLAVADTEQPFPFRTLRVPDRVAAHLLGDDHLDPAVTDVARLVPAAPLPPAGSQARSIAEQLSACLASDRPAYLRGARDSAVLDIATAAVSRAGFVLVLDLSRIPAGTDPRGILAAAVTESRLRGCGLVVGPLENLGSDSAHLAHLLPDLHGRPLPTVFFGEATWDARWTGSLPLLLDVPSPDHRERVAWWRQALGDRSPEAAEALSLHRLSPHRMRGTVEAAVAQAAAEQRPVTTASLLRTARLHNAAGLERVARRVEPSAGWDDLVLAARPTEQLHELAARHRHRGTVLSDWRLRPHHGRGRGVTALFSGESGTGKTLAAEVLAAVSGVDLYIVNLATVVDKYVGETEKNLERIFTAAADAQGMVFFDEADALFGKRSKVTDAHDRFANIETAYLLQRLEAFDGLAVLATNLSGNVDPAFLRRLDTIIHFPRPDAAERARLWDLCLGPGVPRAAGLDLDRIAAAFELNGGNIRSCALTASYQAARTGDPVGTTDLFAAVRAEYHKLGRLVDENEFTVTAR
ncbi:ATP-binding protein [Catenulispora yoronensis]|uniref:ATP-binding protein n=1 Tax=Catenulispora yoronensis TaxID=450799 RepID=A0ABN2TN82_9ACTN